MFFWPDCFCTYPSCSFSCSRFSSCSCSLCCVCVCVGWCKFNLLLLLLFLLLVVLPCLLFSHFVAFAENFSLSTACWHTYTAFDRFVRYCFWLLLFFSMSVRFLCWISRFFFEFSCLILFFFLSSFSGSVRACARACLFRLNHWRVCLVYFVIFI